MNDCPIFLLDPELDYIGDVVEPPVEPPVCIGACNCGYVQFENLLPYLEEIRDKLKQSNQEAYQEFEFRLREQIIEISRLFDIDAGVEPGFFSTAHYSTTQVFPTNGTRFIKIPEFVVNTLEVRTIDNHVLDTGSYGVRDGYLMYLPCQTHTTCGCNSGCELPKSRKPLPWPNACYKVTARWGQACADKAIQMAVREYLIESYRVQDVVDTLTNGITVARTFKPPHSWRTYIDRFTQKRKLFSQFAIV